MNAEETQLRPECLTLLDDKPETERCAQAQKEIEALDWHDNNGDDMIVAEAVSILKRHGLTLGHKIAVGKGRKKNSSSFFSHIVRLADCKDRSEQEEIALLVQQEADAQGVATACGKNTAPELKTFVPTYYNMHHKDFLYYSGGIYKPVGRDMLGMQLQGNGFSPERYGELSEVDKFINDVVENHAVDIAGPFAGYQPGCYDTGGLTILATRGFDLIQPVPYKGNEEEWSKVGCNHIYAILDGMFGLEQAQRFIAWLVEAYDDLVRGRRNGGLCLVILGDPDACKTLVAKRMIEPILGGRVGDAAMYLGHGTSFNDTLIGSEFWLIDEGNPFEEVEARMAFSNMVKAAVSQENVFAHGKGKAGITIPLFRRMAVLCNMDALDRSPDISGSMADKILLLKASKFAMPEGCLRLPPSRFGQEYDDFNAQLAKELPYFLGYALEDENLKPYLKGRFGVEAWQNPQLADEMSKSTPIMTQAVVIFRSVFKGTPKAGQVSEELTPENVFELCAKGEFRSEFRSAATVGKALSQIKRHGFWGEGVVGRILHGSRKYTFTVTKKIEPYLATLKKSSLE